MSTIFVKPKEGLVILDDKTLQPLPVEGKKVEESIYWFRRIKGGDVYLIKDELPVNESRATNNKKVSKEPETRGN